jgi:para-aminobenzoate synthetase component 1
VVSDPAALLRMESAWVDPFDALLAARGEPGRVLLDSGGEIGPLSRWSFLAFDPVEVVEARVGSGLAGEGPLEDPIALLGQLRQRALGRTGENAGARREERVRFGGDARAPRVSGEDLSAGDPDFRGGASVEPGSRGSEPPFTGGVIALLGYDLGRALERLPAAAQDDPALPDLWAAAYDGAIAFDRAERHVQITAWGGSARERMVALRSVLDRVRQGSGARSGLGGDAPPPGSVVGRSGTSGEDGREEFERGVREIQELILAGEIYQANLTRRVAVPTDGEDAEAIYGRLRRLSPTPFGAFVDAGSFQILSASPERYLRIEGDAIETRPIKGTRPRGLFAADDARLRAELLASPKDLAELLMIVDLERNDLGRVSRTGTVSVDEFPEVEPYSTVWHLVATVRGRLREGAGPIDAIRASFPGGSITGAPKIRAMEILDGLEPHRRKFSMGSLLAWDLGGHLDSSILIRTITVRAGEAIYNVGCGIVADSDPALEYDETVAKGLPLVAALGGRRGSTGEPCPGD